MRPVLLAALLGVFPALAYAQPAAAPAAVTAAEKTKAQQLNDERDELKARYELLLQQQRNAIAEVEAEYNRLSMQNRFAGEKTAGDLAKVKTELDRLSTENKLADEKFKALASAQNSELQKLMTENKLVEEAAKKTLADLSLQLAKVKLANDIKAEQQRGQAITDAAEKSAMEMETKRMDLKERQLKYERNMLESRMDRLETDLDMRAKKEEWKKQANTEPVYTDKPFSGGRLVISDRRIALNGPIFNGSADYVTERIHYFNNISSAPVFIVIDNSPGGSVMAGYRILKAMEGSKAPVNVVVKSFAASMAAVIATMAEKSYVYPNAIILHHQMSSMNWGNMTQLKEQLEMARKWEERLHVPVAKKMGVSMEQFRKMMYEKNSDGDWEEFGDKAVDYKWATSVVDRIEETGLVKNPDYEVPEAGRRDLLGEKTDEKGSRYVQMPRLDPYDFYFLYNPDRYYR